MNWRVRTLIVDDDSKLREVLRHVLTLEGYEVVTSAGGHQAITMAGECLPDAVLLERDLPDIDGLSVCRRLRRLELRVPILMFAEGGPISDRVSGLEAGADDYMVKPFSVAELQARLRALVRRARLSAEPVPLQFAELQLDATNYGVIVGEQFADLTRMEYRLLELFMRNPDRLLSHSDIHERVWGYDVTDTTKLRVQVGYVRRKLKELGARQLIHTVSRRGYIMREP
jgi:two-component system response regulator MprA